MLADDICLTHGNRLSFERQTAACDNITRRDRDKKKDEPTETQSADDTKVSINARCTRGLIKRRDVTKLYIHDFHHFHRDKWGKTSEQNEKSFRNYQLRRFHYVFIL